MNNDPDQRSFLFIQTASIGDVILATSALEKVHAAFPEATIDLLVKKGMESLFTGHPFLREVLVWDKTGRKYRDLLRLASVVRSRRYDYVIDFHRFASSGFIVWRSRAGKKFGFDKNPFSFTFDVKVPHRIGADTHIHEVDRNQRLLESLVPGNAGPVRLYPGPQDFDFVKKFTQQPFISLSPFSLWETKQFPADRWLELIARVKEPLLIYLLGSKAETEKAEALARSSGNRRVINLAGSLSLLQTAALMRSARMNFTNDSAPLHLASAMDAPNTAVFCSTVPSFGFGPLGKDAVVIETEEKLSCRPCGLHGLRKCPLGTMDCAYKIPIEKLSDRISYD